MSLNIKWDNFSTNASRSYELLRREEDFFDVTLVSDDGEHWSAHKLVLASSSTFFKNIFKLHSKSHPLLYLSGVHSSELEKVLDYIYQGEVNVREENVKVFLQIAQKLRLEGLNDALDFEQAKIQEHKSLIEDIEEEQQVKQQLVDEQQKVRTASNSKAAEIAALDEEIAGLMIRGPGSTAATCTICGKTMSQTNNLRVHIETHMEHKIAFSCLQCKEVFKNRNSFRRHKVPNNCLSEGYTKLKIVSKLYRKVDDAVEQAMKTRVNTDPDRVSQKMIKIDREILELIENQRDTDDYATTKKQIERQEKDCSKLEETQKVLTPEKNFDIVSSKEIEKNPNFLKLEQQLSEILEKDGNGGRCNLCGKSSRYFQNLIPHIETCHLEDFSFACLQCGQSFRSRDRFRKHKLESGCNSEGWSQMQVVC